MKVGDKVKNKITGEIDTIVSFPGMKAYDEHNFAIADEGFVLKNNLWELQENWTLIGGSMNDLKVGDLLINDDEEIKKVLAKLDDLIVLSNWVDKDSIDDDDDIKRADNFYTEFELEEDGWKKYNPDEPEEMTVKEVCEELGRTIKIVK